MSVGLDQAERECLRSRFLAIADGQLDHVLPVDTTGELGLDVFPDVIICDSNSRFMAMLIWLS